MIFKSEVLVG